MSVDPWYARLGIAAMVVLGAITALAMAAVIAVGGTALVITIGHAMRWW